MAGRTGSGGTCVGIERDKNQLKVAQQNLESTGYTNIAFRAGNAENLELEAGEWGAFDLVHARFVLEHVRQPENVVQGMAKAVRAGGRVVLADDDHAHFCLFPEPPGFTSVWKAYLRSYDRLGNDPYIGRRLVTLLYNAGLRDIRNNVVFFGDCAGSTTFPAYATNLMAILTGARDFIIKEQLIDKQSFDEAIENLHAWSKRSYAALWYSINWAEGRRKD
jgi:SAM-dependent methyltransferase